MVVRKSDIHFIYTIQLDNLCFELIIKAGLLELK